MHLLGGQGEEKMGGVGGDKAITQPDHRPYKELRPIGERGRCWSKKVDSIQRVKYGNAS